MIFGTPQEAGWTRRPDMDFDSFTIWEKPDGRFASVPDGAVVACALHFRPPEDESPNEDDAP